MTARNIYQVLRAALAERIPENVEGSPQFFCAPSIDYLEESFVVASVSLVSRVPHGNFNADMTVEFSFFSPATEDWNTEKTEAAFEQLVEILNEVMTPDALTETAKENEIPVVFPVCRWNETNVASSESGRRVQTISWTGIVATTNEE